MFRFVLRLDIPELDLHREGCWRDRSHSLDLSLILHVFTLVCFSRLFAPYVIFQDMP